MNKDEAPSDAEEVSRETLGTPAANIGPKAQASRYCRKCGSPWDPAWTECEACRRFAPPAVSAASQESPRPISHALWLYFVLLGSSAGGIVAIRSGVEEVVAIMIESVVDAILILAWCLAARKQLRPVFRIYPKARWYLAAVGMAFITFAVSTGAVELLVAWAGVEKFQHAAQFLDAGLGWSAVLLFVCILPAIFEELAFRGIIYSCLGQWLRNSETVVVSALLFMTIHLSVPSFPHLFLIGLGLGLMRLWTGSLYPGMLLHFVHNFLAVVSEQCIGL